MAERDAELTQGEMQRYARQLLMFGSDGQRKLKESRILIAGAGGLGTVIATYLAAAGVGTIRIADHDRVELSNLNRQILHWTKDEGRDKIASVAEKILALNPLIRVVTEVRTIGEETVDDIVDDAQLIVDAMDNFTTRYVLNRAAQRHRIPLFHGAVRGFYGQATTIIPGGSACLQCIFPQGPPVEVFPIVGATCGVIGSIQATEVIKYITGRGELLEGRLLLWDGLTGTVDWVAVERNASCHECGRIVGGVER